MYDIDFFARRHPKPKKTNYSALIVFTFLALLVAGVLLLELGFILKKNELKAEIDDLTAKIEDPVTVAKLSEINMKNQTNIELMRILERLNIVDGFMTVSDTVYSGLVSEITRSVPENCFISDVTILDHSIQISGFADSYEAVAQFQHQLRNIDRLRTVFNPNITKEDANYAYSISCVLRAEVANDHK